MLKTSSIHSAVSIQYRLMTNKQTDTQTQDHSQYCASTASRGKTQIAHTCRCKATISNCGHTRSYKIARNRIHLPWPSYLQLKWLCFRPCFFALCLSLLSQLLRNCWRIFRRKFKNLEEVWPSGNDVGHINEDSLPPKDQ